MRLSFLLSRLAQLVPVLLGVSLVVFLMTSLTPGDPVEIMLGDMRATPEQAAEICAATWGSTCRRTSAS